MRISQQSKQERELAGSHVKSHKRKQSGKTMVSHRQTDFQANCLKKKKKRAGSSWRKSLLVCWCGPLEGTSEKATGGHT